ncbi:hypothetical protein G6F56_012366 [Rhizopus delemar]|nr:hypothetical protein G6F56_012366 [Rhizopus delemar]
MKTWVLLLLLFHVVYCEQKLVPTATTHVITTLINYEDEKGTHRYSKVVATETVYTTVVETASPIVIHSIYDAGSAGQQQQQSDSAATTSSATTASSDEIKSEDNQNQSAIKRMIMILSLVGGLGVIAIVATAVIFTRIRAKNKRKREEALVHEDSIIEQDIAPSAPPPPAATPATPATATITTPPALMAVTPIQGRHISISHVAPSAPTAKELDGVVDDHDEGCSRFIVPEGPPPAYTPSAPPHYALDSLVRRHSLGP